MTQEKKQLLLRDLCARLPYGVICHTEEGDGHLCSINQTIFGTEYGVNINPLKRDYFSDSETEEQAIKPYLRPMSSMTEEEIEFMGENGFRVYKKTNCFDNNCDVYDDGWDNFYVDKQSFEGVIELFYSHHIDYHGLIPMGLALEAPIDMYSN